MDLSNFTDKQLQEEMERRKGKFQEFPARVTSSDKEIIEKIYDTVKGCVDTAIKDEYWDEDNDQYIFEAVMNAFFGERYFVDFHNKRFG